MKSSTQIMKKNEPLKNFINQKESEKCFYCQKCRSEYVILRFEELPDYIKFEFKVILDKLPPNTKAFCFYCPIVENFQFCTLSKNK